MKLIKCDRINDLGVLVVKELRMNYHNENIVNKARRGLGFMKRQAKQFNDPYVTKALYSAIVRPYLEYCSVAWNPYTVTHVNLIESVQKQFLLFSLRGLGWNDYFALPHYGDRLQLIDMEPLHVRRSRFDGVFMFKLMNGLIDSPYLLSTVSYNASPYDTRNRNVLLQADHSTNYGYNEAMNRLTRLYNDNTETFRNSHSIISFKNNFIL